MALERMKAAAAASAAAAAAAAAPAGGNTLRAGGHCQVALTEVALLQHQRLLAARPDPSPPPWTDPPACRLRLA